MCLGRANNPPATSSRHPQPNPRDNQILVAAWGRGLTPRRYGQPKCRMTLFKFLSLFLVKSSGFGAVCPMGILSKNSDSGFFSPLSLARHQTLGEK